MYLTLLNNLLEITFDFGYKGFTFILRILDVCIISIDSDFVSAIAFALCFTLAPVLYRVLTVIFLRGEEK